MKSCALLLGSMLLLLSNVAAAEAPGPTAPSCGEWVAHREKSDTLALGNAYWLQGFLFGLALGSGKDFLTGTDNSAFNGWLDKYCQSNPLKDLSSGASALAAELIKTKRSAK